MPRSPFTRAAFAGTVFAAGAAVGADGGAVARLTDLEGNVLVSWDWNIASASDGMRLFPGTRVLVTTNSKVVVEYPNGCRMKLRPGERFEVGPDAPCTDVVDAPMPSEPQRAEQ